MGESPRGAFAGGFGGKMWVGWAVLVDWGQATLTVAAVALKP